MFVDMIVPRKSTGTKILSSQGTEGEVFGKSESSWLEDKAMKQEMEVGKVRFLVTKASRMSELLFNFFRNYVWP